MREQVYSTLFALLRYEIGDVTPIEGELCELTPEALQRLYTCAKHHDLAHLVADALGKLELLPSESEVTGKLEKQHMMAIYRYQRLQYALGELCERMEQAQIPFIPLKGSVIRDLYPEPWMRTSCDIDVLVHEEDLDRAIALLIEMGYENEGRGSHDVSLRSASGVHVELHYSLLEDDRANHAKSLLQDVWNYASDAEGAQYSMTLRDDFFYFYHIAHMAKHLEVGGCGIRPFLDLWLLDRCSEQERSGRDALLEKAGLLRFANAARSLAKAWMAKAEPDALSKELSEYVLGGGVYGSTENRVAIRQKKKGGRLRYVLTRIFVSYDYLKRLYPVLQKRKWLTPFYEVRRWFDMLRKGRWKASMQELEATRVTKKEDSDRAQHLLDSLGLWQA